MRRVSLDICGKIPAAAEIRDFLADEQPEKRSQLVERLLGSPSYIIHATNLWRAAIIPEAETDAEIRFVLPPFEAWLRSRIAENRNFAEIVAEVALTLPMNPGDVDRFSRPDRPTPVAFYQAKQGKPEQLAAATARLFLGVRLDCAECHDHPFDEWKQEQFWQQAAFFNGYLSNVSSDDQQRPGGGVPGLIEIKETGKLVEATFLDGLHPQPDPTVDFRQLLADWILAPENPYFARAAVNRTWSHFFGIGLVEPMDDFSSRNPPSHPQLLDELAAAFVGHGYDFKFLIRAITSSRTYQLTSRQTDPSQAPPRLFARMAVRGLSPEQIFDSLAQATGYRQPFDPEQPLNFNNDPARQEFLATFTNQSQSALDRTSTILQALSLMNGQFVAKATDLTDSRTLTAVIDAPFLDPAKKVDALYLTTLSRLPTEEERGHLLAYLNRGGATDDSQAALADVFWALLNSSEFLLNH